MMSVNLISNTYNTLFGNWIPTTNLQTQILPSYPGFDTVISTQQHKISNGSVNTSYNIALDATNNLYEPSASLITLTPPQSPPRCSTSAINGLHHANEQHAQPNTMQFSQQATLQQQQQQPNTNNNDNGNHYMIHLPATVQNFNAAISTPNDSVDGICATFAANDHLAQAQIIDQIIEEFAKDLPDNMSDDYESSNCVSSPTSQIEENTTDEEWTPGPSPSQYEYAYGSGSANSSSSSSASSSYDDEKPFMSVSVKAAAHQAIKGEVSSGKKRTRPYGRGIEDRKIRKKEQNKNAATRYRQKKKIEMEQVYVEEEELSQRNKELKAKLADCVREMKYLKSLICEVYGIDCNKNKQKK